MIYETLGSINRVSDLLFNRMSGNGACHRLMASDFGELGDNDSQLSRAHP